MPGAGSLDRRITIERDAGGAVDAFNAAAEDWQTLIEVWAGREDVKDGESVQAGQLGAFRMTRFVIRSSAVTRTVTPKDRVIHGGATFNILGVKESGGRNRFLELTTVREAD